ncbi:hypothetical protein CsSME_00027309 [Camellia sinensis var. sinensis]
MLKNLILLLGYINGLGLNQLKAKGAKMELSIMQPDDWHLHLRDGVFLEVVISHSAFHFGRGIVMPNLKPPIKTTAAAVAYRESILKALPANSDFIPLMTLYLTDTTTREEIKLAINLSSRIKFATHKYHVSSVDCHGGFTEVFLVHGEVTDPEVDIFNRERVFIDTLKVVMEHVTTADAVRFVESCSEGFVAATVTPQHLVLNRNSLFQVGLQPHNYCLPVLKRETHKMKKKCSCGCAGIYNALVALSLYAKVFEEAGALDKLEAFTSFNGPNFYGQWKVPESLSYATSEIIPMFAGETLEWLPSSV